MYLAAAKVGGILANNTYPAEFIYENLMVEANIVHEAWRAGVKKLPLFLGSSCIYPRLAPQPMWKNMLMTGVLEPTNEPYAIAKIAGIENLQILQSAIRHGLSQRDAHEPLRPGETIITPKTATLYQACPDGSMRPSRRRPLTF